MAGVFTRYPGGKSKYVNRILPYFYSNEQEYREPFVGGGSVYLAGEFQNAWINDINPGVYDMWRMVRDEPDKLIELINQHTEILIHKRDPERIKKSLELWQRIRDDKNHQLVPAGYRTLFLTRTCFSGTPTGGPTGGIKQSGKYMIYARWAHKQTIKRILQAHALLQTCKITQQSYENVLNTPGKNVVVFADPPYLGKGKMCYEYAFTLDQHREFAKAMISCGHRFLVTIDNCEEIRQIWSELICTNEQMIEEEWLYSMTDRRSSNRVGKELFVVDAKTLDIWRNNRCAHKMCVDIFEGD